MTGWLVLLTAALATIIMYVFRRKGSRHTSGPGTGQPPPCLPALPIVGSLPFLKGTKDIHLSFTTIAQKYGNVFALYLGTKYYVIINGHEAIREALVKKSTEFADRGKFIMDGIVWTDPGKGIILREYGPDLLTARRDVLNVLKSFGYGSRHNMEQIIAMEVHKLLEHIMSLKGTPWSPGKIFESATLNVIYNLMFGERYEYGDKDGEFIVTSCHEMADSADDALYDAFPILMYFPSVKRKLAAYKQKYIDWINFLEKKVEDKLNIPDSDENFVTAYVKMSGEVTRREVAVMVRDLLFAGTETTSGQLNWALILLANHPEIQQKVQEELDTVVPRDRVPALSDKPQLPYLEATILEVMRIRTAVPLSVNRCTTVDTDVCGYYIPAHTQVLVNLWSAHMDPEVWAEPEVFRPERFLNSNNEVINRELMITFSLGKRSCLGEVLARQEMFLFTAAMTQQFNILPPAGEDKVKDDMCFKRTLLACPHTLRLLHRTI